MTNRTKLIAAVGVVGIAGYAYLTALQISQEQARAEMRGEVPEQRVDGDDAGDLADDGSTDEVHPSAAARAAAAAAAGRARTNVSAAKVGKEVCDESEHLETMGTQWLDKFEYTDGVPMTVRNKSSLIAFIDVKVMGSLDRATTVVLMPGDGIRFPLAGRGSLVELSTGQQWCNRRSGWKDAKTVVIRPAIIPTRRTTQIKAIVHDAGGGAVSMKVFNEMPGKEAPPHFDQ